MTIYCITVLYHCGDIFISYFLSYSSFLGQDSLNLVWGNHVLLLTLSLWASGESGFISWLPSYSISLAKIICLEISRLINPINHIEPQKCAENSGTKSLVLLYLVASWEYKILWAPFRQMPILRTANLRMKPTPQRPEYSYGGRNDNKKYPLVLSLNYCYEATSETWAF